MTTRVEGLDAAIVQVDRQRIKQGRGLAFSVNVSLIGRGNQVS